MVIKFLEQFVLIARALDGQGLYDAEDGFFYDRLVYPSGETTQVRVQTIVGPDPAAARGRPAGRARPPPPAGSASGSRGCATSLGRDRRQPRSAASASSAATGRCCVSVIDPDDLRPDAAASSSTRRRSSRRTACAPCRSATRTTRTRSRASRARGSTTSRPSRRRRCSAATRTGAARSGCRSTTSRSAQFVSTSGSSATTSRSSTRPARAASARFGEIAQDLADRLVSIWLPDADGRRPVYGGTERLQTDPAWKDNLIFNEYFHGDNGAGLGATHQTGWTALVADLILDPPGASAAPAPGDPLRGAAERRADRRTPVAPPSGGARHHRAPARVQPDPEHDHNDAADGLQRASRARRAARTRTAPRGMAGSASPPWPARRRRGGWRRTRGCS